MVPLPWPQYLAARDNKQLQLFYLGWIVDYVDPDDFLVPFAGSYFAGGQGYTNATIASWLTQQAVTLNATQRYALIQKIQVGINAAHIYLWLNNGANVFYTRNWVSQKANAYITSNEFGTSCTAIYGPYYAEIQATSG